MENEQTYQSMVIWLRIMNRQVARPFASYIASILKQVAVILLVESRKGLKKVTENQKTRKNQKISVENWKKHLCRKPENAIFNSRKPGKMGKYGGNRKTQFKICGNRKSPFGSCRKPEKPKKTTKSCGNRKIRKKPCKARKGRYFLRKPGNRPPW